MPACRGRRRRQGKGGPLRGPHRSRGSAPSFSSHPSHGRARDPPPPSTRTHALRHTHRLSMASTTFRQHGSSSTTSTRRPAGKGDDPARARWGSPPAGEPPPPPPAEEAPLPDRPVSHRPAGGVEAALATASRAAAAAADIGERSKGARGGGGGGGNAAQRRGERERPLFLSRGEAEDRRPCTHRRACTGGGGAGAVSQARRRGGALRVCGRCVVRPLSCLHLPLSPPPLPPQRPPPFDRGAPAPRPSRPPRFFLYRCPPGHFIWFGFMLWVSWSVFLAEQRRGGRPF